MDKSSKQLSFSALLWLSWLVSCAVAQNKDRFIYHGFHGANLSLDGVAKITSNGLLQLTNTSKQSVGHAFRRAPVSFEGPSLSFSTSFVLAMVPELPMRGGHGLAFVISQSSNLGQRTRAEYLGLMSSSSPSFSSSRFFAVEFDTVLTRSINDINDNHVGVDLNSLRSADSASASYYSRQERQNITLGLISGDAVHVWVDYDDGKRKVNVTIAPAGTIKPDRPLLSTHVNLSKIFSEHMYVGFSAGTGTITSEHYILGWSFSRTGRAQNLNILKLPQLSPSLNRRKVESLMEATMIAVLSVVAVTLLVIAVTGGWYLKQSRMYKEIREDWEKIYGPQRLSYVDLHKGTKGFSDSEVIGEGGFGKVYKGTLAATQTQIAVKKVSHDSDKGMEQFVAEIAAMGRLKHRNLVHLVGYCRRKGELILVYDYMPNGSLDQYLFSEKRPSLCWSQRMRVLRDVASALLYLHEEWEQVVLHRDIKASNVLLDADFNARLGDFGLATLRDRGADARATRVVGTVGYLAPELSRTGKPTTATDVFSFGVFMLEVACGRRPLKPNGPIEEILLVDWVLERSRRGDLLSVSDPKLKGVFDIGEMALVLKIGLVCLSAEPAHRPTMRKVVQYFDSMDFSSLSPKESQEASSNSPIRLIPPNEYPNSAAPASSTSIEMSSTCNYSWPTTG